MATPSALRLAAGLVLLLAACQTSPPPLTSATTDLAPNAARERVAEALGDAGLTVERAADGLRVRTSSASYINCPPVMVRTGDDRRRFTQVDQRQGVVDIRFVGNGRTTASWQTDFSGRYMDRVNNRPFERPCGSTGQLEGLIARSLGG